MSWNEFFQMLEADREQNERHVLRTLVYENPHAAVPLPRDIFNGPYDECWGPLDDQQIGRIVVGTELKKLEETEQKFDLHLGPIHRMAKNGPRGKRQWE